VDSLKWIRLYPIPFRDLDQSRKFKKYNVIRVKCQKANESRIESYKIDCDSIEIIDYLDTRKDKWEARKKIVLPTLSPSFCRIKKDINLNKSLGVFRPYDINFFWEKTSLKDITKRDACYIQLSFFGRRKDAIEQIPFNFYYTFKCKDESNCPGHKLQIVDWEIMESYRDWRHIYGPEQTLLEKIRERWLTRMCSEKNDVSFYVGNLKRFHNEFMVLGVFYPPKKV